MTLSWNKKTANLCQGVCKNITMIRDVVFYSLLGAKEIMPSSFWGFTRLISGRLDSFTKI